MYERLIRMLKMNDVEYKENQKLSSYSSIKIGGKARLFVMPDTTEKLVSVLQCLKNDGYPFKLVGKMTNLLPPDEDIDIPIVTTRRISGFKIDGYGEVVANTGESLSRILHTAADKNLGGAESLSGIPGTIGGLITMNAGAFGSEISGFFSEAVLYDIDKMAQRRASYADMRFSYRSSAVRGSSLVVLSVTLKLKRKSRQKVLSDIELYRQRRRSTQPNEPSLGSVFMRQGEIVPARLIDELGFRGFGIGGACVSEKHAGFIVNRGGASANDFKLLTEYIKSEALTHFGVALQEEVEYL